MQRGKVLFDAASSVINGERQTSYGNPEDSFEWIAQRWNQYLQGRFGAQFKLTAEDTTFMMADFKMARECNQHKADNLVDAAGYLGINHDIASTDNQMDIRSEQWAINPGLPSQPVEGSLGFLLKRTEP